MIVEKGSYMFIFLYGLNLPGQTWMKFFMIR
jgi:hypothetical protein